MRRFADLFIAICIPVVAVSAGVIAYNQFAITARGAAVWAGIVFVGLVLLRLLGLGSRARREAAAQFAALSRRLGQIDGDITAIERRLTAIENGADRRTRDEIEPFVAEIEVIGTLTRQVIETVADLEVAVTEMRGRSAGSERPGASQTRPLPATDPPVTASPLVPDRFAHLDADGFLALVRAAIDGDRIDLHLQPIVTLPQRKVRFYECLTRLRTADGETIHPSDYIPVAEARGFIGTVDQQILIKSVQILRRLATRSKEIGIFLNLSPASLGDSRFFEEFVRVLEDNRDLCDMLVLEFPHPSIRAIGPIEVEGLRLLRGLGFRFSIDQIADLKIGFQNLADLGFRYVKITTDRLLGRTGDLGTDIHPADLADYFARFGMELIADHVEREVDVVDVLDFGIRLGQGFLFAPPRPVRAEVVQAPSAPPSPAPRPAAAQAVPPRPPATAPSRPATTAAPVPAAAAPPRPTVKPPPRPVTAPTAQKAGAETETPRPGIRIVPGTAAVR